MKDLAAGIAFVLGLLFCTGVSAEPWNVDYDFDGDGTNDQVIVDYTGGAHCCYTLTVRLSTGSQFQLPFYLDGGYVSGLDLSFPERFDVGDFDGDSFPEIFAEIQTYNGEPYPLDADWTRKYGIVSHFVIIDFSNGDLRVTDAPVER